MLIKAAWSPFDPVNSGLIVLAQAHPLLRFAVKSFKISFFFVPKFNAFLPECRKFDDRMLKKKE